MSQKCEILPTGSSSFSSLVQKCFSELFGTMILLFGVTTMRGPSLLGGPLLLAIVIWLSGPVSGGHVNPIVTVMMMAQKKIPLLLGLMYWAMQVAGAYLGCAIGMYFMDESPDSTIGMTTVAAGVSLTHAFMTEFVVALFFSLVILSCTDEYRNEANPFNSAAPGLAPFLIGLCTAVVGYIAGPVSGGSVNPARSIGPALANRNLENQWIYVFAPFCACFTALLLYKFVFDPTMSKERVVAYFKCTDEPEQQRRQKVSQEDYDEEDSMIDEKRK